MSADQVNIATIKLNNGLDYPLIGLGTYATGDDKRGAIDAIKFAINIGYRHIDGAWLYGNEVEVGTAIKEAIAESNGRIKREDLFIVNKVWNTHHRKELVRQCLNETLKNLDLEYIDLYLVHWPMGFAEGTNPFPIDANGDVIDSGVSYLETYQALEELLAEGKVKSIGVSNFNISQLEDVLINCKVKPVTNQIEAHLYLQNEKLIKFCQSNDIAVTAFGVINNPGRTDTFRTPNDPPSILQDPVVLNIAQKHGKSPAQICLKWGVQNNIAVIPKSTTHSRLKENAQLFDFTLSDEDLNELKTINKNFRIYNLKSVQNHKLYPFKEE